ncbi:MAG TPA: DmsC/YnfH family molybdoenzyme membrane anchor subunit [Tepidisphaeraceae bacterium]|jgi:Fe-S-cluster-containing dehydrogenase component/DMSO reductase anchor subunit
MPTAAVSGPNLIDQFLSRQRELTAVETFAQRHEDQQRPAPAKLYRDLLPAAGPGEGQQYAFDVDLDACSGCKACVTACHSLNGLDENEMWRDVGLLVGGSTSLPVLNASVLQHVTSACHHCLEPACMEGCPVLAYEKDPHTGIVRHLDDQCIGCQYCILKCPYDVPKYNARLGIVRKCDMCSDRLSNGDAPACVAGCPNQAIRITVVDRQQVIADSGKVFLPGAPKSDYTLPTTNYRTKRPLPANTLPADYHRITPQHAHLPLVVMLVLTQLSVGTFAVGQILNWCADAAVVAALRPVHALVALALGMLALGASVLHLGRPRYAYRAFIGLRTSWLSREIVAFGVFAALASVYAAASWIAPQAISAKVFHALGTAVAAVGALGVFCSVMVYHDTRRPFWRFRYTASKFFLSTLLLGLATTLLTTTAAAFANQPGARQLLEAAGRIAFVLFASINLLKIIMALLPFRHLRDSNPTPMQRTAQLGIGPLHKPVLARILMAAVGGILLPLLAAGSIPLAIGTVDLLVMATAAFALTLLAELLERYLFFTAVVAPKMPGGPGA